MQPVYDTHAAKRPANLSVNGDLLAKAQELDINLSATLTQALVNALREKLKAKWLAENRASIDAYNDHVERHGVFSDGQRNF